MGFEPTQIHHQNKFSILFKIAVCVFLLSKAHFIIIQLLYVKFAVSALYGREGWIRTNEHAQYRPALQYCPRSLTAWLPSHEAR